MSLAAADALMNIFGFKRVGHVAEKDFGNKQVALILPWPPSVNHYWGQSGTRRYITKRGQVFRALVADAVSGQGVKMEGRLSVFVALFQPDKRKCDIDNYMKALLDSLQHAGLFEDDEQIDQLKIIRCDPKKGGECRVVVTQA